MNDMIENILEPIDRRRTWWREYEPLPYPEPLPLDWKRLEQNIQTVLLNGQFNYQIAWREIKISAAISRQEAHFWLTHMLDPDIVPRTISYDPDHYDGNMTVDELKTGFSLVSQNYLSSAVGIPLHVLFDVKDYIPLLLSLSYPHFVTTWAEAWLPYLTEDELETVRQLVRPTLQSAVQQYTLPPYNSKYSPSLLTPIVWAMQCGLGQDLYHIVSKCADDYYTDRFGRMKLLKGNDYADVFLSLPTKSAVVEEIKRVKLALCEPYQVRWWLAHTGTAELEYVRDSIAIEKGKIRAKRLIKILGAIETVEVAGYIFELMSQNVSTAYCQSWLQDHPELTVQALISFAQGQSKQAELARNHLRVMLRDGYEELVTTYADDSLMDKLIDRTVAVSAPMFDKNTTPDWLTDGIKAIDRKVISPRWVTPTTLPPLVADGHQLTEKQVKGVIRALKAKKLSTTVPSEQLHKARVRISGQQPENTQLLDALKQHADRHLLDNFLWRLMEQWKLNGERKQDAWAFYASIRLGTDKLLPKLTPVLKEMVGRRRSQRNIKQIVYNALDELAFNGSDTAYMQLEALRPTFHAKRISSLIDSRVRDLAKYRNLSEEELQDHAIPDCGLDENGTRIFDYGRRQFTVVIGNDLTPMVRDEKGKLRKNLPKPGKLDDNTVADPAYESWKFIKKQIRETIKRQTPRLEQAMVFERRWTVENFEKLFIQHPTMRHIARDLVWGVYRDKDVQCTFRIASDGQLMDYADKVINVRQDIMIGIVHPIHVDEVTAQQWQNLFLDFEIIPLFPQMNRPVFHLPERLLGASEVNPQEYNNAQLHILAVRTKMFKAGYSEGYGYAYSRYFPQYDVTILIGLDQVDQMSAQFETAQYFSSLRFNDGIRPQSYGEKYRYMPLKDVPPLVFSEAIHDIKVTLA